MKAYFRFIGTFLFIDAIVGIVILLIGIGPVISNAANIPDGWLSVLQYILILVSVVVFGPALGLLFISHSDHLDDHSKYIPKQTKIISSESKEKALGDNWSPLEENIDEQKGQKEDWHITFEKRKIIGEVNYDSHLSEKEIEELMKLPMDEFRQKLGK